MCAVKEKAPICRAAGNHVPLASCGAELSTCRATQKPKSAAQAAASPQGHHEKRRDMSELSHSARRVTVRALVAASARRLARAKLYFGHGTDNAADEAAALVWHMLKLPYPATAKSYARRVGARARKQVQALVTRRIRERIPAAYLTGARRLPVSSFMSIRGC